MKRILGVSVLTAFSLVGGIYWYLSRLRVSGRPTPVELLGHPDVLASTTTTPSIVQRAVLPQLSLSPWLIAGLIVSGGLMLFGWLGYQAAARRHRDAQRRADLALIKAGFESYKAKFGHYPVSETFDAHYYSLVNLSADWRYYGLPETAIMQQFLERWPILDPLHPIGQPDQTNQYLYYPHDQGQRYDLFAHLEVPTTHEAEDCNQTESIPLVMGRYNFRLTSPVEQKVEKKSNESPA